jgi:anti-anti-sigma factor
MLESPNGEVIFDVEIQGDVMIITPDLDLTEPECYLIRDQALSILKQWEHSSARHLIVDLRKTDRCGSSALGFFVELWKLARAKKGRMALCNVSPHEREILEVTRLRRLWPEFENRAAALAGIVEVSNQN